MLTPFSHIQQVDSSEMYRLLDPKRKRPFCNAFTGNFHCFWNLMTEGGTRGLTFAEDWRLLESDGVKSGWPTFQGILAPPASRTLKVKAVNSPGTSENICQTQSLHNPPLLHWHNCWPQGISLTTIQYHFFFLNQLFKPLFIFSKSLNDSTGNSKEQNFSRGIDRAQIPDILHAFCLIRYCFHSSLFWIRLVRYGASNPVSLVLILTSYFRPLLGFLIFTFISIYEQNFIHKYYFLSGTALTTS
jgi:hypothetical protein